MNGDEMSRGMYQQNRRPSSPSRNSFGSNSNYSYNNYNSNNGNGNGNGNSSYSGQQQSYRKPGMGGGRPDHGKFKSHHGGGSNDKILKQNDQIIKLLKEIRDRLPAPPPSIAAALPAVANEPEFYDQDRGNAAEYVERGNERDDDVVDADAHDDQEFVAADEPETFDTEER